MKRKLIYLLITALLGIGIFVAVDNLRLLLPGFYFEHQTDYNQYSIHSDQPINRGVTFILEEVSTKLGATELYSGDEDFTVFFCYDASTYARFARELGMNPDSQGLTIEPLGYVMINLREIGNVGREFGNSHPYSLLSGSATHVLAHELTHVLITNHVGMFASPDLPSWKREGYAEYAASRYVKEQDSSYSFKEYAGHFFSDEYDEVELARQHYIKYELIVEYLLDVKELAVADLLSQSHQKDTIFNELKQWVNQ